MILFRILEYLFIIILVLYFIKMIARLVLPLLFQKVVKKAQEQVNNQYQSQQHKQQRRPTGSLKVDYIPPKEKEARAADRAGDFIDFEEVK